MEGFGDVGARPAAKNPFQLLGKTRFSHSRRFGKFFHAQTGPGASLFPFPSFLSPLGKSRSLFPLHPTLFPSWKSLSRPRRQSRNLGWMGISTFPSDPWKSRNRDSELRDIPQPHFQRLWLDGIQRKIPKPQNSSLGSAGAEEIQPLKRKT